MLRDFFFNVRVELHKDDRANVKNSFQILLESEGKKVKKVHYDSDEDDDHLFGHRYHLQWRQIRTTGVLSNKVDFCGFFSVVIFYIETYY